MDYEQKYKEALEKAKTYYNKSTCLRNTLETLENIFPELNDSEDERIRKEIVEMLRNWASVHYITKEQFSERMTWLEKQKDTNVLIQEASEKAYTEGMRVERKHWLKKQCQTFTKKDVDDAYLKGVWDAKQELEKQGEQEPAEWSEEDEEALEMAIIALEDLYDEDSPHTTYGGYNMPFDKAANQLKSLKERIKNK